MKKISKWSFLVLFVVFAPIRSIAQRAVLHFEDELCQYEGIYDTHKYTAKQLQDTYRLTRGEFGYFGGDNTADLALNYKRQTAGIRQLQLVPIPFFKSLRDSMLDYFDQNYIMQRVRLEAKANPSLLLEYHQDRQEVKFYSEALVKGGEQLMEAYESLIRKQMAKNSDPDRLWRQFTNDSAASDNISRAFKYVLEYGWWNAVNAVIPHVNYDGRQLEAFRELFVEVKTLNCDEP